MTYAELKTLLNNRFATDWAVGAFYSEAPDGGVTLNFVSDIPLSADNLIYRKQQTYQLSFFSSNPEVDIDSFFTDNKINYTLKTKAYLGDDECWQTTYTFQI